MLSQLGTNAFNILEANCPLKKECFGISYKFTGKKSTLTVFWVSFKSLKADMSAVTKQSCRLSSWPKSQLFP